MNCHRCFQLLLALIAITATSCQDRSSETLKLYEFFQSEFESREKKIDLSIKAVTDALVRLETDLREVQRRAEESQKELVTAVNTSIDSKMAETQSKLLVEIQKALTGIAQSQTALQAAKAMPTQTPRPDEPSNQPQTPSNPNRVRIQFPDR